MANLSDEAARIGYVSGVRELGPLAQRVIELENQMKFCLQRIAALETSATPVHLSNVEKR